MGPWYPPWHHLPRGHWVLSRRRRPVLVGHSSWPVSLWVVSRLSTHPGASGSHRGPHPHLQWRRLGMPLRWSSAPTRLWALFSEPGLCVAPLWPLQWGGAPRPLSHLSGWQRAGRRSGTPVGSGWLMRRPLAVRGRTLCVALACHPKSKRPPCKSVGAGEAAPSSAAPESLWQECWGGRGG